MHSSSSDFKNRYELHDVLGDAQGELNRAVGKEGLRPIPLKKRKGESMGNRDRRVHHINLMFEILVL